MKRANVAEKKDLVEKRRRRKWVAVETVAAATPDGSTPVLCCIHHRRVIVLHPLPLLFLVDLAFQQHHLAFSLLPIPPSQTIQSTVRQTGGHS